MPMSTKSYLGLGPHGFHRIVYFEWGDPANNQVVVCVHGLTRRGRDFDFLAQALEDRYRVICVDLPGRGDSDWLPVAADYQPSTYVQDMAALIARLDVERMDWIGISLGGLIGMRLAEQPNSPIGKLVLVDIGGYIGRPALERIAGVVSGSPSFPNLAALEAYLREVSAPYGPLTDEQWGHIAQYGSRQDAAGAWRLHYDPGIAEPFREGFAEAVDLWSLWQVVSCPVLVLRGKESDVLLEETAERMRVLKPSMPLIEFAGVGHPPMLMDEEQTRPVREWLLS